jgi:hypothetical protein
MVTWKACLKSPWPESALPLEWLLWAAESKFRRAAMQEIPPATQEISVDLDAWIAAYQEACPQACGLVPLVLPSVGLVIIRMLEGERQQIAHESLRRILKVLPDSDKREVIPDWLWGTREWVMEHWMMGQNQGRGFDGDLLASFIEEVKELAVRGVIEEDTPYEHAMNFVHRLRERREALPIPTQPNGEISEVPPTSEV